MTNKIYIAVSLDGFIADEAGSVDWLNTIPNPDQSDHGFSDFMDGIDALVMGRNTFEQVLSFNEWIYTKPVFVLSNHRKDIPEHLHGKVSIINGDVRDVTKRLHAQGFSNLYIDGGMTIREFLKHDLIDEMIITYVSVVLGGGISLFGTTGRKQPFKLEATEKLNENLVKLYYVRA